MPCKSCQSSNLCNFNAEINIHFPGLDGLTKPTVWVFPKLLVCLDCGLTEFLVPTDELLRLAADKSAAQGAAD
jgi:hypothetical protein